MAFDEVQTEDVVLISGFWDLEVLTVYIGAITIEFRRQILGREPTNFEIWPETPSNPHLQTTETPSNLHLQMFSTTGQLRNLAEDNLESTFTNHKFSTGDNFKIWPEITTSNLNFD